MDKDILLDVRLCCLYAEYLRDCCGLYCDGYDRAVILYNTLIKLEEKLKNEKEI